MNPLIPAINKIRALRSTAFLAAAVFSSAAGAATLYERLDNGLEVIIREDRRAPVVVTQLWYKVGSRDEKPGKTGLSHALEHMMFKGTETVPAGEFSRRIAALGGKDNAYTTNEVTVYHETVAAQHLPEILSMEADRMANLNFSNADFDNEMQVIKEERRMRVDDSPAGRLWEKTNETAFRQPYNRAPVIGYPEDLETLKADDLRRWYHSYYAPDNAVLVIVGDVRAAPALAAVKAAFSGIPAKKIPPRPDGHEPSAQWGARAATSAPGNLVMLNIAYSAPNLYHGDGRQPYALQILDALLSGGDSSRIMKNIVRSGKTAVSAGSSYDPATRADTLFVLSAYVAPDSNAGSAEKALRDEIDNIARDGISAEELARVRTQIRASRIYAKDSMSTQASTLGTLANIGRTRHAEEDLEKKLAAVSAADVRDAARFLQAQQPAVITAIPEAASAAARHHPAEYSDER